MSKFSNLPLKNEADLPNLLNLDNKELSARKTEFGYLGMFVTPTDLQAHIERFANSVGRDAIGAITLAQGVCNYYATWLGNFTYLLDEKKKRLGTENAKALMDDVFKFLELAQPVNKEGKNV